MGVEDGSAVPIPTDVNKNPITPHWCPLNTEPITIIKKTTKQ